MRLEWKSEYSVNVAEMDRQHMKLIGFINELYDAIKSNNIENEVDVILAGMKDYAKYHFSAEERYFEEFGYHEKNKHISEHNRYSKKASGFQKRISAGKDISKLADDILKFLERWWIKHINKTDKKYTKCFNNHGLR